LPAASKVVDLQVGTAFSLGNSDYQGTSTLKGFGFYTSADFRYHFGIEAEFHQLEDPGSQKSIYERTYEIGPRYVLHFGPFAPYTKLMAGRGVFNFPPSPSDPSAGPAANLAYNIWAVGIGSDYSLRPSLNVRIDYEYQRWNGFPPNGLSPEVFSFGVAYHFH
jgi:opacity protein-like surface antigen